MTEVINEVRVSDEEAPTLAEEPPAPVEKQKTKRAAKPKATAAEPAIEVKPALEEVQAVVELPKDDVKQACPDCGKQMSAKTLKYSHVCPTKKTAAKEQQPEQEERAATKSQTVYSTDELIKWETQRRMSNKRNERKAAREQMLRNLAQSAFSIFPTLEYISITWSILLTRRWGPRGKRNRNNAISDARPKPRRSNGQRYNRRCTSRGKRYATQPRYSTIRFS